jgi:hypothetical protein
MVSSSTFERDAEELEEYCKLKRVNSAFRSVSTPRRTKDLLEITPVNPTPRSSSV